jgi:hypothetical protein
MKKHLKYLAFHCKNPTDIKRNQPVASASIVALAPIISLCLATSASSATVSLGTLPESQKVFVEEYNVANTAPADYANGMEVYDTTGGDFSATNTATAKINNQWVYREANQAVLIHNNGTISPGTDIYTVSASGTQKSVGLMVQIGSQWWVSSLLTTNPYGAGTDNPAETVGFASSDANWFQLTATSGGADLTGGFTAPDYGVAGSALPSGDWLNTGVYGDASTEGTGVFFKTFAVTGIPEPSSLVLGALGGLLMFSRRR